MKIKSDKQKGIIAVVLLSLVIASTGLFARALSANFTPLQQVYLRICAALIFGILLFYKNLNFEKLYRLSKNEWGLLLIRSAATYLLGVTLFSKAVTIAKISTVAFISALPIVAILAFVILKEKVTLQKIIYLAVGFAGIVLISVQNYSDIFNWGPGELLALVSTSFLSLSFVLRKKHNDTLNNQEMSILMFFISAVLLIITSTLFQEHLPAISTWSAPLILVIVGAGLNNIAYMFLTNYGFQKIEAVLANNLLILSPLFAVIFGFLFYKEFPSTKEWVGGALILASAYLMNKASA